MTSRCTALTGATGLLGSHIAEALVKRGHRVRALVRPASDTTFLKRLGVELVLGDLQDSSALSHVLEGADVVHHCAARVGDWGPWSLYQREIIKSTELFLSACRAAGVPRIVYVSSVTVYGHPLANGTPITEDAAQGQRLYWFWDYYCRSKIAAEALARAYGPEVTIVRPGWIYGPRDRNTLPRLMKAFRAGRVSLIGKGDNLINIIHAADVAEGCLRAASHPAAAGRAYNLCSEGELSQRQFLDLLCDAVGQPRITRRIPFSLAYLGGFISELIGRGIRLRRPPHITRYAVGLVGRPTSISIRRAREELGWQPQVPAAEGLRQTLAWWREHQAELTAGAR